MYQTLKRINARPEPFSAYTAETLWNDPHTSKKMPELHLNPDIEAASRSHAFIERSIAWMAEHFGNVAGDPYLETNDVFAVVLERN